MGSHRLVSALRRGILDSGLDTHRLVFAAADSLQQSFSRLSSLNVEVAAQKCVLLTSSRDQALIWSDRARSIPGFVGDAVLEDDNRISSGERAGFFGKSLCVGEPFFRDG